MSLAGSSLPGPPVIGALAELLGLLDPLHLVVVLLAVPLLVAAPVDPSR